MKKFVPYFLLLFSIINCSSASNSEENFMSKSSMSSPEMAVMRDSGRTSISELSQSNIDKKIQKNANLSIEVKDIEKSLDKAKQIISTFNGEIISTSSGGMDFGQPYANIRLRVPSEKLNDAVEALKKISSKILSENIYTNDVTEEFIDIEAKLNIMKSTEKRFNDLLNEAKNVEEVIQVEKELMRIRGEIDSLEGRLGYLSQTTDTSEINLSINEEVPITGEKWSFSESLSSALKNLSSFAKSLASLLINLVVFIPVIIVILIIAIIIRIIIKRRKS
jgi:hypothetical protein